MQLQQPKVLYTHVLLENIDVTDKISPIHVGLDDIEIVKQSHVHGETSEQIFKWHSDADFKMLQTRIEEMNAVIERLITLDVDEYLTPLGVRNMAKAKIKEWNIYDAK